MLPNAILSEQQVASIKRLIFEGSTIEALASKYEVNYRTISHIKCGRTWEEVTWPDGRKGAISGSKRTELVRLRMKQRSSRAVGRGNGNEGRGKKKSRRQKAA